MTNRPTTAQLNPGPGFRIRSAIQRPDRTLTEQFQAFATPDISDILNRLYAVCSEIQNIVNDRPLVGPAVTVKVFPGDNLMVHKALDLLEPGDVMVIDAAGSRHNAVIGDMIANKAKHRGAIGFVVDGVIRDLPALRKLDLPVYARGVCSLGPLHRGPGEVNYPVNCGGVVVHPGDIVTADQNGVVIVHRDHATAILQQLTARQAELTRYEAEVRNGNFSNRWVDELLNDQDCPYDD